MMERKHRPECDRFPEGTQLHRICTGEAVHPAYKINAYRASWGLDPIPEDELSDTTPRKAAKADKSKAAEKKPRPKVDHQALFRDNIADRFDMELSVVDRDEADRRISVCLGCPGGKLKPCSKGYYCSAINGCSGNAVIATTKRITGEYGKPCQFWSGEPQSIATPKTVKKTRGCGKSTQVRSPSQAKLTETDSVAVPTDYQWRSEHALVENLLSRVSIVVKSHKRFQSLLNFVSSVRKRYATIPIHVADDSFRDGRTHQIAERVKSIRGVRWYSMAYDSGLPAGRNAAVQRCNTEFVVLCDDDYVFTDETDLAAMLIPLEVAGLDLCGGLIRSTKTSMEATNWCGTIKFSDDKRGRLLTLRTPTSPVETVLGIRFRRVDVTYNFFAARRSLLLEHPWDESYIIAQEHLDSFVTWSTSGAKIAYTIDSVCNHTHEHNSEEYRRDRARTDNRTFNKKWGIITHKGNVMMRFLGI